MVLPSSGALSLNQIQTEFGGFNPIMMNEYYRGGFYVNLAITAIPASGTISISNFYGTSNVPPWPCINQRSEYTERLSDTKNWTNDIYGEYFTPTAGSFTFYFNFITDLNVSMTAYLYRGFTTPTLLTSRTTSGTFTTTLLAEQHRFRLVTVFSNIPASEGRSTTLQVKQSTSTGCFIQTINSGFENLS